MEAVTVASNPTPAGLTLDTLRVRSGVSVRYAVCGVGAKPNRGTVCVFPGRGEFIEKYFETIRDLRERNFAVAIIDWRGQGGSSRLTADHLKSHVPSFAQYDEDLVAFMREVALPDCPAPFYALAHSMGANIILRSLETRTWFSKVVATAPLIGLRQKDVPWGLVRALARLFSTIGLGRMTVPFTGWMELSHRNAENNYFSSDRERIERTLNVLGAAPGLAVGRPTFGWLNAAFAAMERLDETAISGHLQAPVLIVASGNDRVVSNEASREFCRRVDNAVMVTIRLARHEILMEVDLLREQFWAAFDSFIAEEPKKRYGDAA